PPAGLPAQPAAERRQVPPDQYERLGVLSGDKQRLGEQGAEGGLALRLFLGGDHGTRSVISMTCSGPVSTPSSVLIAAVPPSGTRRSRTSRLPSLVTVFTSVSPGARAASASPSRLRKRRNALGSSTSRSDSSAAPLVAPGLPELRRNPDRWGLAPRRPGRHIFPLVRGVAGHGQVPGGGQAERRPPQPVSRRVVRCLSEPPGERSEVRRSVRPA